MRVYLCLVAFLVSQHSELVSAVAERCYFCNTEVHGQSCDEPINTEGIAIQRCSDSEIEATSHYSSVKSVINPEHDIKNATSTRNYGNICVYMTYVFNSRNVTARGCEVEYIDTNIGTLDICAYYLAIIPARITNYNCTACAGELCNHQGYVEEAEEEEEAPADEGDDAGDGGEAVPPEGDGDGANAVTVSFSLLLAGAVARAVLM